MMQQSSTSNLDSLKEDEVMLPDFLSRQESGLFVDLSVFPVGGGFDLFLDRLFAGGSRFLGLNYRLLMDLLYFYDDILGTHGKAAKLKLARDIVAFPPRRRALYKAVKVDDSNLRAEYFFEPVVIEVVTEDAADGVSGANGAAPGSTRQAKFEPTSLDLDEFVADMWLKGVRFGIDVEAVTDAISRRGAMRTDIAAQLDATEGRDAEIEEECNVLHRDNSPKTSVNGQVDLRRFQNRFPQISTGVRLLKKKPRVLGRPGYKVNGAIIEPAVPNDLDLSVMVGPGTRVEIQDGIEYILASRDGFLSLDIKSNHISVTEKIENKGGISIKTTGDLSLTGNEFIEHGEVQEGSTVEGKNMTFYSDVYGNIISQGGLILFKKNLSSGSAKSIGGDVTVEGRAFNSIIRACDGQISLKYAESCLILGQSVLIERAVNCDIIAENIQIKSAEGCYIAGKDIQIESSAACRGKETVILMMVPDLSALNAQVVQVRKVSTDCKKIIETKDRELALLKSDPEAAKYFSLAASLQKANAQLNPAQQENWQKITAKFAKAISAAKRLDADKQEQLNRVQASLQEQTRLMEERQKACAGIRCGIIKVAGETMVRSILTQNGIAELQDGNASKIKSKLREQGLKREQIFTHSTGSLDWSYTAPVEIH